MDSFEFNKIAGVVLTALLIIFGGRTIIEEFVVSHGPQEPAYQLAEVPDETAEATETASAQPAEEGFSFEKVASLLQSASAEAGQSQFRQCSACHTVNEGGANRVGPNLWNIVGRDIGVVDGFNYSSAMAGLDGDWTYEKLALFLHDPKGWLPGTKMAYAGIEKSEGVANMLAYLRSLSNDPAPLPEVAVSGQ